MEEKKLEKKFGLITAICMVIGIVIGSGVFFKAQNILNATGGNMPLGILAWILGATVMIVCALAFSVMATRYEKVNGVIDYAEATVGKKYAYYLGWFMTTIYYPGMTSVLAWVSARYTIALFVGEDTFGGMSSGVCLALAAFYLCASYTVNALSPKIAGKFQVSTTAIKLIPLLLMAIVGIVVGIMNGNTLEAFRSASVVADNGTISALFAAVVATAFAYEGWVIATAINAELKNAKKNLPIALVLGCGIVAAIYITYYIGLAGAAPVADLQEKGAITGFTNLFGDVFGTVVSVLIVISCLGTLNGLMFASCRGLYSVAVRSDSKRLKMFREISEHTNMPSNSSVFGLFVCAAWLFYFFGANLMENPLFGLFSFDSSELPIITIYAFYIPVFILFIKKYGKESRGKNTVLPLLAMICCGFMVFCALWAHGISPYMTAKENGTFSFPVLFYLIVFAVIMFIGFIMNCGKKIETEKAPKEKAEEGEKPGILVRTKDKVVQFVDDKTSQLPEKEQKIVRKVAETTKKNAALALGAISAVAAIGALRAAQTEKDRQKKRRHLFNVLR